MIQAAFSQIARKRLVGVSLGILGPSIESCPREPVEGHYTGFAGLRMELIRVYPANPVNSFLFVVHALNQRPDRITGKRRISPLVHIGENIGIWRPPYPWGLFQQLNGFWAKRCFAVKGNLFALHLHAGTRNNVQPPPIIILLDFPPCCFTRCCVAR